jgi:hypothetical protein
MGFTRFNLRGALREPLLHFIVFGALVFGADHLLTARRDGPNVIVMDAAVDEEARSVFRSAMGREATPGDMKVLRQRWLDNEVLYREGLALRVDQGDVTIRERVIFKALSLMEANLSLPPTDEAALRTWFDEHRADYDEPKRFDFLEALPLADASGADAAQFAAALNRDAGKNGQGSLRVFKGRPRGNLVASYGEPFAAALESAAPGRWQALPSADGPRVIRLDAIAPGQKAAFEAVQARVYQDWKDASMQQMRTGALRELGRKYTVRQVHAEVDK